VAKEHLELERLLAVAIELHPDHWPGRLRFLGERIAEGTAWANNSTDALALALVGRDPSERPHGLVSVPMTPRARSAFARDVARALPLRIAIIEAIGLPSEPATGHEQIELFGAPAQ
jgi:hypothetical protein